jgi:hypothetical protein
MRKNKFLSKKLQRQKAVDQEIIDARFFYMLNLNTF